MSRSRSQAIPSRRAQRGFNLVELLAVLVIMGVVMAVGGYSFRFVVNSGRITNPANELLATLQLARIEAVRRGQRTVICRSENAESGAPTCTTAAGQWAGWLAFVDNNRNGVFDPGGATPDVVLKVGSIKVPTTIEASPAISGAGSRIVFRSDGMARTATGALLVARVRMCVPDTLPADNARDVIIAGGSRVSVVRSVAVITSGACAAPANT